jgi:hypothetical protein
VPLWEISQRAEYPRPHYCRLGMGDEVPTGTPTGDPERIEASEIEED